MYLAHITSSLRESSQSVCHTYYLFVYYVWPCALLLDWGSQGNGRTSSFLGRARSRNFDTAQSSSPALRELTTTARELHPFRRYKNQQTRIWKSMVVAQVARDECRKRRIWCWASTTWNFNLCAAALTFIVCCQCQHDSRYILKATAIIFYASDWTSATSSLLWAWKKADVQVLIFIEWL